MKLLFWNTHNNNVGEYVASIVEEYNIDIIILAEVNDNRHSIVDSIERLGRNYHEANTIGCKGIEIWYQGYDLTAASQAPRYSLQMINNRCIMCCMHLQSDLHYSENERFETTRYMIEDVRQYEAKYDIHKIVYIGDMNEMPYSRSCLSANGLYGLPVLSIHEQPYRLIQEKNYRKCYNPMWNFFGDDNDPPGTYYYKQSKLQNPMWYILDQVIISQELVPLFKKKSLKIVNSTLKGRLDDKYGRPNVSDHFPIVCEILDEEGGCINE